MACQYSGLGIQGPPVLWFHHLLALELNRKETGGHTCASYPPWLAPEYHLASKPPSKLYEAEPTCHHMAKNPDLLSQTPLSPKHGHVTEALTSRHVSPTLWFGRLTVNCSQVELIQWGRQWPVSEATVAPLLAASSSHSSTSMRRCLSPLVAVLWHDLRSCSLRCCLLALSEFLGAT